MDFQKLDELYAKIPANPQFDLGCIRMKAFVEEYGSQRMSDAFVDGLNKDGEKYMYGKPARDPLQRIQHIEKSVCNQGESIGKLVCQNDQIVSDMQKLEKRVVEIEAKILMASAAGKTDAELKELRENFREMSMKFVNETGVLNRDMVDSVHPFDELKKRLQQDQSYADSWHDNIACAILGEGQSHKASNHFASRIMSSIFCVKTKNPVDR